MEHVFIINPAAGKGRQQRLLQSQIAEVFSCLQKPYEIYITKGVGDATSYVSKRCSSSGKIRFYACGGDGTLNEVVNGVVGYPHASVTVIPCGTGNDFIKQFSTKSGFLDIAALAEAEDRQIDLIKINERWTVNMCNIGFDAYVAFNAGIFKKLPLVKGSMAYTLAIFYSFLKKIKYPLVIEIDGRRLKNDFLIVLLANGSYYGGGYHGAPYALAGDGLIDFLGVTTFSRLKMLSLLKTFKIGRHLEEKAIKDKIIYKKSKKLSICSDELIPVCIDGDFIQVKEINAHLAAGVLNFAVPE